MLKFKSRKQFVLATLAILVGGVAVFVSRSWSIPISDQPILLDVVSDKTELMCISDDGEKAIVADFESVKDEHERLVNRVKNHVAYDCRTKRRRPLVMPSRQLAISYSPDGKRLLAHSEYDADRLKMSTLDATSGVVLNQTSGLGHTGFNPKTMLQSNDRFVYCSYLKKLVDTKTGVDQFHRGDRGALLSDKFVELNLKDGKLKAAQADSQLDLSRLQVVWEVPTPYLPRLEQEARFGRNEEIIYPVCSDLVIIGVGTFDRSKLSYFVHRATTGEFLYKVEQQGELVLVHDQSLVLKFGEELFKVGPDKSTKVIPFRIGVGPIQPRRERTSEVRFTRQPLALFRLQIGQENQVWILDLDRFAWVKRIAGVAFEHHRFTIDCLISADASSMVTIVPDEKNKQRLLYWYQLPRS